MTEPPSGTPGKTAAKPRTPEAFTLDDPNLELVGEAGATEASAGPSAGGAAQHSAPPLGASARLGPTARTGIRWGAILLAAGSALASLAFALSFARFVAIAFERNDWIGWTAFVLLSVALFAGLMLLLRELFGFRRLRRLGRLRADAERLLREPNLKAERKILRRLTEPFSDRPELKWPLARLAEHARDVRDPGDLLRLADRDLLAPIDGEARRVVAAAARRIGTVSAISPTAFITVGWVLIENLRLLRSLAALYGGRPGFVGTARLARMVFTHIVATGGVALTDDFIGQFLGQDILRRLSRRLGESVFNAALTARIGAAAIEVIRPLPYIEAPRIRARDFLAEITRRSAPDAKGKDSGV